MIVQPLSVAATIWFIALPMEAVKRIAANARINMTAMHQQVTDADKELASILLLNALLL
jgi:hypothetical protein